MTVTVQAATVETSTGSTRPTLPAVRAHSLDRLRGLAVLCMVADHLALFAGADAVRWTVGRLAFPLFLLLAGHLARRPSWRLLWLVVLGQVLYALVPWSSADVVLLWLAAGSLYVALLRGRRWALLLPLFLVLVLHLNGFVAQAYDGWAALAICCAGALLPRSSFAWAGRLPAVLGRLGRWPLTVYACHLLVLAGAVAVWP